MISSTYHMVAGSSDKNYAKILIKYKNMKNILSVRFFRNGNYA